MKGNSYKLWIEQAEFDLKAAEISLNSRFFEWTCYQAVQSVEKGLKSIIVHSGMVPPKTHELGILLGMCNRANPLFTQVKFNFRKLESYTFVSRYPFIYPKLNIPPHDFITEDDARSCLNVAKEILNIIEQFLHNKTPNLNTVSLQEYYFTNEEIKNREEQLIDILTKSDKLIVKEIILFGSFAREKNLPKSKTMDIFIIAETEMQFIERINYVRELTQGGEPIVEPIVYTPAEFKMMQEDRAEGFIESALREGRSIYKS